MVSYPCTASYLITWGGKRWWNSSNQALLSWVCLLRIDFFSWVHQAVYFSHTYTRRKHHSVGRHWRKRHPGYINIYCMPFSQWEGDRSSLPVWKMAQVSITGIVLFLHRDYGIAATLCTSSTACLAISYSSFGWYWVWIHNQKFSHAPTKNRLTAKYLPKVQNSSFFFF